MGKVDFVGGFYGGGIMAFYLALHVLDTPIQGLFVLSGVIQEFKVQNSMPIFVNHSKLDPIVSFERAMKVLDERL